MPVYISNKLYSNTIDLLYWVPDATEGNNKDGHNAWIKNFSALMSDLKAAKEHTLHWGKNCLGNLKSENVYELDKRNCRRMESCCQVFMIPEGGTGVNSPSVTSALAPGHPSSSTQTSRPWSNAKRHVQHVVTKHSSKRSIDHALWATRS